MSASSGTKRKVMGLSLGVVLVMLLAALTFGLFAAANAPTISNSSALHVATGSSQQWAFGGVFSEAVSCAAGAPCLGTNFTLNSSLSISVRAYLEWVVIYTETNISSTQTQIEGQTALNASVVVTASGCFQTNGSGCTTESLSLTLAGSETSTGFTNVTNAGSVDLYQTTTGTPGFEPAWALMNANSNAAFNFSFALTDTATVGATTESVNENFDLGGNEATSVNFATPLGIVPLNPQPGDAWNSSAAYTATGTYTSGYTVSVSYPGYSNSTSNWTKFSVSPSGTLTANGTDLGAYTLYDNYTNPPSTVTAQEILVEFGNGAFYTADGWLLTPSGLYGGALGGLLGTSPILVSGHHPSAVTTSAQETAYFEAGKGFVGADQTGAGTGLSGAPNVNVQAGPEPVTVAQGQYSAITTPSGSSGNSFPVVWLVLAVVIVVVVIVVALVAVRRSRRRPPAAAAPGAMPMGAWDTSASPPPPPPSA